jgi:UDP-N-acetylglucosamine--N-acetylmuramyl-(pentapeptide) pyrophosphoryl-undecaprenol N-acetylglucosamine transferase
MNVMTIEKSQMNVALTAPGLRVVVAGGGTGGHLYPGIAIAEAFLARSSDTEVRFLGAKSGIESRVLPKEGWDALFLDMARIRGGGFIVALKGILKVPVAVARSIGYFREFRPDLVVGVGGYASGAAMIAAFLLGIPRVVQEQNAVPGMTNRVAGKIADRVYTSFPSAEPHFPTKRVRCLGNPIRAAIREALMGAHGATETPTSVRNVLVFGGSQGARFLNQEIPSLLHALTQKGQSLRIVHQTGVREEEETRARYVALGVEAEVLPYVDDMAARYSWADLAICRAGASTLAELTAVGLPSLLVPFPYAANDHQTANARAISEAGGGITVPQETWDEAGLANQLASLFGDGSAMENMAAEAREQGRPQAAAAIAEDCVELLRERGSKGGDR